MTVLHRSNRDDDIDICRAANLLIRDNGDQAAIEAAQRADAMLDKSDLDGKAVWLRVLKAVKDREPVGRVH